VGGRRSHDNTAQSSGTSNARAKGPSSPSDTAGEKEHAVRLVRQLAAETGKEAGEISRVAHQLGFGAESVRSGSARPTSTRVDPGVTSSEAARIRDRVRTGSSAERTRSSCRASGFFAAAETARNVPRPVHSTGGSAEPICRRFS